MIRYLLNISFIILAIGIISLTGCSTTYKRHPLPEELSATATVPGIPRARFWGDEAPSYPQAWLKLGGEEVKKNYPKLYRTRHNYLAISGGGVNGAFSAGLLSGWTDAGNRPEFSMVTGISTGALIAPFAFLGPAHDAQIREIYTSYSTDDLVEKRSIWKIFTWSSAFNTSPLMSLIAKYFTQEILNAIAVEHRKGRRLLIGTTHLDAARPVIWSIGEIAVSGGPKALALAHKVILASASIPAAFPPVFIEVKANGKLYDEMHVDGGATTQVFLYPTALDLDYLMEKLKVKDTPNVYVIRNSRFKPQWEKVNPSVVTIAGRTVDSLIRTQGIGDLYRIYFLAQRDGLIYNLAYIPSEFDMESHELFDKAYMGKLFELGYQMAKDGFPWQKAPPGFESQ